MPIRVAIQMQMPQVIAGLEASGYNTTKIGGDLADKSSRLAAGIVALAQSLRGAGVG